MAHAECETIEQILDTSPVGIAVLSPEGEILRVNDRTEDILGVAEADLLDRSSPPPEQDVYDETGNPIPPSDRPFRRVADTGEPIYDFEADVKRPDGDRVWLSINAAPIHTSQGDVDKIVATWKDITARKEQERELKQHRDKLATLDRINTVIREINQALVDASSREEIEERVCDLLTESDPYRFAWIGEPNYASREIEPRASAGKIGDYLGQLTICIDEDQETGRGPGGRAARTREPQITQDISDDPAFESYQDLATEYGYRSVAAIPIKYESTLYGILSIYADRPYAFDDEEKAVLTELGETIGHAINSLKRKQAIVSNEVVKLTFEHSDPDHCLISVAQETGADFRLEGIVPKDDDTHLKYFTGMEASPSAVLEEIEQIPMIADQALVSEHEDDFLFELVQVGPSPATVLAEHGAKLTNVVIEDGEATLVTEMPQSFNVRQIIEALESMTDEIEVVSQRHVNRSGETIQTFRSTLDDEFTDRQRTALDIAYYSGFFEWPRDVMAKELADSLEVSPPTFHQHLRAAQRKLLEVFFDD